MSQKIIPTGRGTATITSLRLPGVNTKVTIEVDIPATDPDGSGIDIPGSVQVEIGTEKYLSGFESAKFTDNGDGTIKLTFKGAFSSKKPNTSSNLSLVKKKKIAKKSKKKSVKKSNPKAKRYAK